jgi:manganese efflux pump family protein
MYYLNIVLISLGLSMDATAVSISSAISAPKHRLKDAAIIALTFGLFQAIMPMIGYAAGKEFSSWFSGYDHWIAFGLLAAVGAKMLYESLFAKKSDDEIQKVAHLAANFKQLLFMAVATSVDALAVGVSLSLLDVGILQPCLIIGFVTFLMSLLGSAAGKRVGLRFGSKIEAIGGVILIGIGVKILVEHLYF